MSISETELRRRDSLTVRDAAGTEREVYGWVTIERASRVRGSSPHVEQFEPSIYAGDSRMSVEAVTHWVARNLRDEFNIDVQEHGIDVIDPTDDAVRVL